MNEQMRAAYEKATLALPEIMCDLECAVIDATLIYLRRRYTADLRYNDEVAPELQKRRLMLGCELDRKRTQIKAS